MKVIQMSHQAKPVQTEWTPGKYRQHETHDVTENPEQKQTAQTYIRIKNTIDQKICQQIDTQHNECIHDQAV